MPTHHDHDQDSTWMIGYLDIMTLLVALMVLIFTLTHLGRADDELGYVAPLPSEMIRAMPWAPIARLEPDGLTPKAIAAALGVAGPPARLAPRDASAPERMPFPVPPTPLALLEQREAFPITLPEPLLPDADELPLPLADYMLVLTDNPPAKVREIDPDALAGSEALQRRLSEQMQEAPYLADLEGVEVSRVAEGIRLRVEDRWLFPTAAAELTDDGEALIQRLVDVIQRHEGEVAVEGHTDSRPIETTEFPSNWVLSSARAIAIVHALERAGVDARRLRAVGLADTRPLADNDSAEGRAQNRRVEVIIHAR
ncbi:OmpA family protein [Billgrantia saliphila]|uniref:OmpA family protein n=1 Tax=Billgrantia saliphila TaxID=1848458 RepID=UPI001E5EA709|nr:OmpA family protein [Halomonas saliphila]